MKGTMCLMLCGGLLGVPISGLRAQAPAARPPAVRHDLTGRDQCLMCHAPGIMEPVPDVPSSHADRPNAVCLWCHAPDAVVQTKDPPTIPHATEGRETCLLCHTPGRMEAVPDAPASHQGWPEQFCRLCHKPTP